jgi:hypothetical protein
MVLRVPAAQRRGNAGQNVQLGFLIVHFDPGLRAPMRTGAFYKRAGVVRH